jgi:hypothetical protein
MNDTPMIWRLFLCAALTALAALTACSSFKSTPPTPQAEAEGAKSAEVRSIPPRASLDYIETERFDQHLGAALASDLPKVQVRFVYPVKPGDMPEKLQHILTSIKRTGGVVDMAVPATAERASAPWTSWSFKSTMDRLYDKTERFFNGVTSTTTGMIERAWKKPFESIETRNAEVEFGSNKKGEVIITAVNFTKRVAP